MNNIKHTEEDTFNKLRKTPFNQLLFIFQRDPAQEFVAFLQQHGWTYPEYLDAARTLPISK